MEYPLALVLLSAAAGIGLSITVQVASGVITLVHEGGHALFGFLMGGTVRGIELEGDGGATDVPVSWWLGDLIMRLAGYVAPSMLGLVSIFLLLSTGDAAAVLWAAIGVFIVLLFWSRNVAAYVKVTLFGVIVYAIARSASEDMQLFLALTWIWWLLVGAPVSVLHRLSQGGTADADVIGSRTFLPARLWDLAFLAGTAAALVIGAGQLLGLIGPGYG